MAIGDFPMLSSEEPIQQRCSESMAQMEELLSRTSKLTVTDEEGWEINEAGAADIGKLCLIGRLCTMKPFTRSLLKNILCRLWNLGELEWDLKIKKITAKALFLIISFKQNTTLERILGRTPWVLNAGFLLLERMNGVPTEWETTLTSFTISGRILNLPIKAITKTNMLRLAGMAGEVVDIQEPDINRIAINGRRQTTSISGDRTTSHREREFNSTTKQPESINTKDTILTINSTPPFQIRAEDCIQETMNPNQQQAEMAIRKRMGTELGKEASMSPNKNRYCKAKFNETEREELESSGNLFDVPITYDAGKNNQ
ncbi:hypothetical protein G4B88_030862 [Cannabis sativa]|uniref:DUF4283 domain-containing protein n=1 Tax=Cannabis sativa TaxID=3483 RepID=A0A7J6FM86_CANSA|nr:hypothetical protein G4B88_030862 [Cannabis sativa]